MGATTVISKWYRGQQVEDWVCDLKPRRENDYTVNICPVMDNLRDFHLFSFVRELFFQEVTH